MQRRQTKQRATVYAALQELYHPTADEVYDWLSRKDPGIGRATVFRNLSVLTEEGLATKLLFPGNAIRYDADAKEHDHFVCNHCGCILDLPRTEPLPLPQSDRFDVLAQSTSFYGICKSCKQLKFTY